MIDEVPHSMMELLPFILFGLAFAAVIAVVAVRSRRSRAARLQRLAEMGFSAAPEEKEALAEKITWLENNSGYRYSVAQPTRVNLSGKDVYFYQKSRHRSGSIYAAEELLLPLSRPSQAGLMLFVKPSDIPAGTATKLIGAVATGAWDAQPDDLTKLALPVDLQGTNLVGAMGPAGASLYDLIDTDRLSRMLGAGDCGAFIILCRGDLCSMSSPSHQMPMDLDKAVPFIRDMI
jgi:hypothetical protein